MKYPMRVVIYQGRRYRPGDYDDRMINVVSEDPSDLDRGFLVYAPGVYLKPVPRTEVDAAYRVYCYAVYRGVKVDVLDECDGKFLIQADHRFKGDGWHWLEHGVWVNWVTPDQLTDIEEEKEPF